MTNACSQEQALTGLFGVVLLKYRSEIDGLRAVAVVPVILFHAGFDWFSGGFVGVDVFFVISGYLITSILIDDLEKGRFSILSFYERRAKRILPALFFVILVCIPFAWSWMLPSQMEGFAKSLVAVSFFVSNILFWLESDYFDPTAEEKPLLHTWSLSVEEQFYLLFPIFLLFTWKYGKNRVFWIIILLAAISLMFSEWGWRNKPTANFYLAPTRAWELFAGSIAAFIVQKRGVRANNFLSSIGLLAIVYSIFVFDETTPFPSVYSLVPVTGVVLLVLFAKAGTWPARILSSAPFVGLGLISYSAYLWHQPLFAFARIRLKGEPEMLVMILLSLSVPVLAYMSWRYIERPFRKTSPKGFSQQATFALSLAALLSISWLGVTGYQQEGFKNRFDIADTVYDSMRLSPRMDECFNKADVHTRKDWFCTIGTDKAKPSLMIFGDSHALSFLPAADEAASQLDIAGIFAGIDGCTPFLSIYALRSDQNSKNCHALNIRVFEFVKESKIENLILVARWTYYTDGGYEADEFSFIARSPDEARTVEESRAAFEFGLAETIKRYRDIGVNLVIVPQIPQQLEDPLKLFARNAASSHSSITDVSVSRDLHRDLQDYVNQLFTQADIPLLEFTDVICNENRCPVGTDTSSYYFDEDHLSLAGSELLVEKTVGFISSTMNW